MTLGRRAGRRVVLLDLDGTLLDHSDDDWMRSSDVAGARNAGPAGAVWLDRAGRGGISSLTGLLTMPGARVKFPAVPIGRRAAGCRLIQLEPRTVRLVGRRAGGGRAGSSRCRTADAASSSTGM